MDYELEHQDWEPVVLKRQLTKKEKIDQGEIIKVAKVSNNKQGSNINAKKIEDEDYRPPMTNREIAIAISKARVEKGYKSQEEFAKAIAVDKSIINAYENPNKPVKLDSKIFGLIKRKLGLKLKKPEPKKMVDE